MVRQADIKDVSRIAEILIFTKRMAYRPIFHDDKVSFGQMQVVPLAAQYMERPEKLLHMWVYDDLFVKGLITLQLIQSVEGGRVLQVEELYVDVFFQHEGIGQELLSFAEGMAREQKADGMGLWVRVFFTKKMDLYCPKKGNWKKGRRNILYGIKRSWPDRIYIGLGICGNISGTLY